LFTYYFIFILIIYLYIYLYVYFILINFLFFISLFLDFCRTVQPATTLTDTPPSPFNLGSPTPLLRFYPTLPTPSSPPTSSLSFSSLSPSPPNPKYHNPKSAIKTFTVPQPIAHTQAVSFPHHHNNTVALNPQPLWQSSAKFTTAHGLKLAITNSRPHPQITNSALHPHQILAAIKPSKKPKTKPSNQAGFNKAQPVIQIPQT
jgi:hypothetical protein